MKNLANNIGFILLAFFIITFVNLVIIEILFLRFSNPVAQHIGLCPVPEIMVQLLIIAPQFISMGFNNL